MKMKAWVLEDIGNIKYKEVLKPQISENEVLVQVKAAGICGSDIPRIYQTGAHQMPLIPGHEFSGQVVVNWEEEYSNDYAAGYVYKQSPVAGRTVREGQSVTLTVSLGIHYVTVPDLTNYVQADGEQQLKDLGVSVLVTQAVDESVAAGSIIRTDPAAGSQVAAGTTVVIYVSRPQVATTTKVPSLIGMNVDDARTLLVQRKLGLGSQTEQYSDQPVGSIISQNPGEGASAKLNTRVSVVVSAGPEPAPEPEAPSESTASSGGSGGWLGGLFGGSSSSSESTGDSSSSSTGGGLSDWWTSWLG